MLYRYVLFLIASLFLPGNVTLTAQDFITVPSEFPAHRLYHSSSAAWGDVDGDGYPELYITSGEYNQPSEFYRNNGLGGFDFVLNSITELRVPTFGACFGDYDNDGDLDLYVGAADYESEAGLPNYLFNNNGNGVFAPVYIGIPVTDEDPTYAVSWIDYDADGHLDLFVVNAFQTPNRLYRNLGDGSFASVQAGALTEDAAHNIGCAWSDFDRDGDQDVVTVSPDGEAIQLYRNDNDGSFTRLNIYDLGFENLTDCRSAAWRDYDNDGWTDLLLVDGQGADQLYRNLSGTGFSKLSTADFAPADTAFSGNGSAWGDFDNDGDADLLLMNHFGVDKEFHRNLGDGTLVPVEHLIENDYNDFITYALCPADYDNDGRLDLFQANRFLENGDGNPAWNILWRNINSDCRRFAGISLRGTESNSFGVGAKVWVFTSKPEAGMQRQLQEMQSLSGGGYTAQSGYRLHVGLGNVERIDSIQVDWPSGQSTIHYDLPTNRHLVLYENGVTEVVSGSYDPVIIPERQAECPGRIESLRVNNWRGNLQWFRNSPEGEVLSYGTILNLPPATKPLTYYVVDACGRQDSLTVDESFYPSRVFPNPVSSTLQLNLAGVNGSFSLQVSLYDVTGKLVREQSSTVGLGYNLLEMDVQELASGIYFLVIDSPCLKSTEKILIQR